MTSLTDPPTTGRPGESFIVTAAVKNQGAGAAFASATKFFLVPSGGGPKKNLKGLQNVPALAAGETQGPAVTIAIYSDTLTGSYLLQACADGGNANVETIETNNCRTAGGINVLDVPNLVVISITNPPASVGQGQPFQVTAPVQNTGAVDAAASTTKFFLVPTAGGTKIDLKGSQSVPAIGAGQTFTQPATVTVRPETVQGQYNVQACADSGKIITEKDENNCLTSTGAVQVTAQPDLIVTSVTVQGVPLTTGRGGTVVIDAVVKNQGAVDAGASTMKFVLVNTADSSTKNLKGTQAVGALAPGATQSTHSTVTVFDDTPFGTFTVQACIDSTKAVSETSEGNNCTAALGTVSIPDLSATQPDFVVTALTNPPANVVLGGSMSLTATVKNRGGAPGGASSTKFFLIPAAGSPRKSLKGLQSVPALAAGASGGAAATVAVFSDTVPGLYSVQACANGDGLAAEADTSNNCFIAATKITVKDAPDLAVTALSLVNPPASFKQGQAITLSDTVKNLGTVASVASTTKYYLVSTADASLIDLKGTQAVPALSGGQIFSSQETLQVRPETLPGSYNVRACADSGKVVAETSEGDNCFTAVGSIQVTALADLLVTTVTVTGAPVTVARGGTFSVSATVKNQGLADAGAASTTKFTLIRVGAAAIAKTLGGTQSVPALVAGASQGSSVTVTVPSSTLVGTYAVQACADSGKVVAESSEGNNCATSVGTVKVQ